MLNSASLFKKVWHPIKIGVRNRPYPMEFLYFLRNQPPTQITKIGSGLTVATEERKCFNACIGIFIDGGSRYETNFENGITHFFEHIIFKSTKVRTGLALQEQMSATGARFFSFTTREMVGYYAQCLSEDVPLVLDILTDCIYNNAYETKNLDTERCVIYSEMKDLDKSSANDLLWDYVHSSAFQGTPLAQTVMGPSTNLQNFNAETISRYQNKYFSPLRAVLVAAGGVRHDQMVHLADTYMRNIICCPSIDDDIYRYTGSDTRYRDDSLPVANAVLAVEGPSFCDDDNVFMEVAAASIGGWNRTQVPGENHSSRVARLLSEGHIVDSYRAFNLNYKDTGLWGVQFTAPSLNLEDASYIIQDEWMRLSTIATEIELQRARRELKTKLLTNTQTTTGACLDTARWILYTGTRPPVHERLSIIDGVHADKMREVCNKYIYDRCPIVVAVGATEGLPDYTRLRASMYWLRT